MRPFGADTRSLGILINEVEPAGYFLTDLGTNEIRYACICIEITPKTRFWDAAQSERLLCIKREPMVQTTPDRKGRNAFVSIKNTACFLVPTLIPPKRTICAEVFAENRTQVYTERNIL